MPLTPDQVADYYPAATDRALLADVCSAVNEWVSRLSWVSAYPGAPDVWPRSAEQGAVMLAARMYRRRNTPGGVEAFTDTVVYVPRRDSDVDMFLRIGAYQHPAVG